MRNPCSYVVGDDLAELPAGFVDRHVDELWKMRRDDGLPPTALAIAAILMLFRGLRFGPMGCGVQASLDDWARLLGRSRRMVAYAFKDLEEAGWAVRQRRKVKVNWVRTWINRFKQLCTRTLVHADVHGVAYLTTLGLCRLTRRPAGLKPRGELAQLVVRNGREVRVLFVAGLVGELRETLGQKMRLLALRVTDAVARCTPSFGGEARQLQKQKQRGSPVGNASGRGFSSRPQAAESSSTGPPGAGMGAGDAKRFALYRRGQLTPANAFPDDWTPLRKYERRTRHHWWLIRLYLEKLAQFSWLEEPSTRQLELAGDCTRTWPKRDHWESPETKAWLALGGHAP